MPSILVCSAAKRCGPSVSAARISADHRFLASEAAHWITGDVIHASGGHR
jgi:hypothetical protein